MQEKSTHQEFMYSIVAVIVLVVGLIILIRPLIMQENAFRKIEGKIATSHMGNNHYRITLSTSRIVYRAGSSHKAVLQEKAIVGGKATIWYNMLHANRTAPYRRYIIQKMIVDNEVVIPFRTGRGSGVFISIILVLLIATIRYIIKLVRKKELESEIARKNHLGQQ